ncbi:MAG: archease [Desulfobacterales bacterium]|nr:archease [Desulfobacterales bacterium]
MVDQVKKYEFIDHTADLGIEVYGRDLKGLFQNAGQALFEIICDPSEITESIEKKVAVDGEDLEQLMVVWLGELLYLHDVERLLLRRFEVEEVGERRLTATVYGEELKEGHHTIKTEIKAVTYHQIQVRQEDGRWIARVIFDL